MGILSKKERSNTGEEVPNGDGGRFRAIQNQGEVLLFAVVRPYSVSRRARLTENLDGLLGHIHDPVIGNAGGCIDWALFLTVFFERGVGHFDDQAGVLW